MSRTRPTAHTGKSSADSYELTTCEGHRIAQLITVDQQVRAAEPDPEISQRIGDPELPLLRVVQAVMAGYADRPALGQRASELVTDPATGRRARRLLPRFETITYRETWCRAEATAAALHHRDDCAVRAGDVVALCGFTSADYTTLDLACVRLGAVALPLQISATSGQLRPVIAEAKPKVLASSIEMLATATACALESRSVRCVLVFDYEPLADDQAEAFRAAQERLASSGIGVHSLADLIAAGNSLPAAPCGADAASDRLALLLYTSGSTDTPKGAMYPDRLVAAFWRSIFQHTAEHPAITLTYLPMSHAAGRLVVNGALGSGGTVYFTAASDLSTLFEDLAAVRPTEMLLVPRLCESLFQHYQTELERRLSAQAHAHDAGADARPRAAIEAEVRAHLRDGLIGGRLVAATTGSAPLQGALAEFMQSVLGLPLHSVFGATETGMIMIDDVVTRPPVIDYRLIDVPELGYFSTDAPHPRGELAVKSQTLFAGYYRQPGATADTFDAGGYYRTGDIMAETAPDRLVYLERRTSTLKLSDGEFVAVSHLEALFATGPLVRQIFLYGDSERAYLLAVVVPTETALAAHDPDELRSRLAVSMRLEARDRGLRPAEIPRSILVEPEPFSTANGLLSDTGKPLRPRLVERYRERLEQLYADLAEKAEEPALLTSRRGKPTVEAVLSTAAAVLGTTDPLPAEAHFTDLGGDSLSAVRFADRLSKAFGVEVTASTVSSPAATLRHIANYIDKALRLSTRRPTAGLVHGIGRTRLRSGDLALEKFIEPGTLAAARTLPRPDKPAHTVLLTGANGYLGRFLCLEWLTRSAEHGGKLVCVVRGENHQAARRRLVDAFDSGDPELKRRFADLAGEHLEVLAGDVAEPYLGLDQETWHGLADTIDLIVHQAAQVNHLMTYEQLFGPNVLGTAELIRLALTARIKPLTYLSTLAVTSGLGEAAHEDADIRAASPERLLQSGYAHGYTASKWASEVLLRNCHAEFGVPVTVFRPGLVMAHTRYAGQLNVADLFTRFLFSLITTGLAPGSLRDGRNERDQLDGLPVDSVAQAVAAIGMQASDGYRTYNMLSPRDGGIVLNDLVDALGEAGFELTRINSRARWLARLTGALTTLPENQRRHSLLPLIDGLAESLDLTNVAGVPASRFRSAMREVELDAHGEIPRITRPLIQKYIDDMRHLTLI
ncbi:carboxylic acid reductase [Streptomyces sp. NBC_01408]|uniref:carboxylic acid reductase n=1 Tax=Streptomyces sp. NBC_01408 TaxID=2903855 RepID=UPI002252928D|nr:carboxylic acid reductase [Streptomyces sp. NBC_01408]MCX4695658.1 thioester reductase domain-containing protein [Streptomyces sp. NBC_01408]